MITEKINELLDLNKIEPTYNFDLRNENNITNIIERQKGLIAEIKELSRAQNTILGRTVEFSMVDNYALYIVTKVNETTAQLTWLRYSDGCVEDRLGYQGNIDKVYIESYVKGQDQIAEQLNSMKIMNL